MESKNLYVNNLARFYIDASFQGVKRLFVNGFNNTTADVVNNTVNNTNNRIATDIHRKIFSSKSKYNQ